MPSKGHVRFMSVTGDVFSICTGTFSVPSSAYGIDDFWAKIKGSWAKGHSQVQSMPMKCVVSLHVWQVISSLKCLLRGKSLRLQHVLQPLC
jgi:hypothetical protein